MLLELLLQLSVIVDTVVSCIAVAAAAAGTAE